jgi:hypothetical protein
MSPYRDDSYTKVLIMYVEHTYRLLLLSRYCLLRLLWVRAVPTSKTNVTYQDVLYTQSEGVCRYSPVRPETFLGVSAVDTTVWTGPVLTHLRTWDNTNRNGAGINWCLEWDSNPRSQLYVVEESPRRICGGHKTTRCWIAGLHGEWILTAVTFPRTSITVERQRISVFIFNTSAILCVSWRDSLVIIVPWFRHFVDEISARHFLLSGMLLE